MNTQMVYNAPVGITVGTTSTALVVATGSRKLLVLTNDSDAVIYLGIGSAAVLNKGMRLEIPSSANKGSVLQFGGENGLPLTTQAVNAISVAGSKVVLVQEAF